MEIKVLGMKLRVELILMVLFLGWIAWLLMVRECSKITVKEGLAMLQGSPLDHRMGENVHGSWDMKRNPENPVFDWSPHDHASYQSEHLHPDDSLHYLAETEFKPECCSSRYSSKGGLLRSGGATSGGCACLSEKQLAYLNSRGGNRGIGSEF